MLQTVLQTAKDTEQVIPFAPNAEPDTFLILKTNAL